MSAGEIEAGDRIIFNDPSGVEEAFSGTVFEVMTDAAGDPVSAVVECDDGKWAAIDLTLVTIGPASGRLH